MSIASRPIRVLALACLLATLLAARPGGAGAQGTETYESPTYGFTLDFDGDEWEIAEDSETTQGTVDRVSLQSTELPTQVNFIAGTDYDGDSEACLEGTIEGLERRDTVESFEPLEEDGDPVEGELRGGAGFFAAFEATLEGESGPLEVVEYVECRVIEEDESNVIVYQLALADFFEDANEAREDLLEGLELPEAQGGRDDEAEDETPEPEEDEEDEEETPEAEDEETPEAEDEETPESEDEETPEADDEEETPDADDEEETPEAEDEEDEEDEETPEAEDEDEEETPEADEDEEETPEADEDEDEPASDGDVYESPNFGYTLTFDPAVWEIVAEDENPDDDFDFVQLSNGTSLLTFQSDPTFAGDLAECVETYAGFLEEGDNVDDFAPVEEEIAGGPPADEDDERAYATFTLTFGTGDDAVELVNYLECRVIEPGESNLVIIQSVPVDDFEDEAEEREDLLEGLELPEAGADEADEDEEDEETPEADEDEEAEDDEPAEDEEETPEADEDEEGAEDEESAEDEEETPEAEDDDTV